MLDPAYYFGYADVFQRRQALTSGNPHKRCRERETLPFFL